MILKFKKEESKKKLFFYFFLPLTALLIIVLPFLSDNNWLIFLILITYFILIISFLNNKWGLFLFLILRPALDFSTHYHLLSIAGFQLNFAAILGVIIIIFTFSVISQEWKKIKGSYLFYSWLLFLFINFISLFFSFSPSVSLAELARLLTIFSMFILGSVLINNNKDLTQLIKVIIFSSLIPSLVAFWQLIHGTGLRDGNSIRVFGTFAHPNMLAFFLSISIMLTMFIFLNVRRDRVSSIFYIIVMIFEFILLIFTYTRGAWLLLFFTILIIGLLKYKKFLVGSLVVLFLLYISIFPFQSRLNSMIKIDPYGSIAWRIHLWTDAYSYIKDKPIIGYGTGTAAQVIANRRGINLGSPEPHNDYIRVGLNTGVLGLISYLILLISLLLLLIKYYRQQDRPRLKVFNLFFLSFSLSLFIMSFGDNILNNTSLQWLLWVLSGALISSQLKLKKSITT